MTMSEVEVQQLEEQHTAVVRTRISAAEAERIPALLQQTYEAVQNAGQQPAGMPFLRSLSFDPNAMDPDAMDIEVGWPLAAPFTADVAATEPGEGTVIASTLPGGPAAVASYFGPYEEIGPVYEAIPAWCVEHGREIGGAPWESYVTDPTEEPDPSKWRTDVHFPLKPR